MKQSFKFRITGLCGAGWHQIPENQGRRSEAESVTESEDMASAPLALSIPGEEKQVTGPRW